MNLSEWALPPLALCLLCSKRHANAEVQSQDIELKDSLEKKKAH
ncbi:hypothetical protein [Metapseudomonas lalkuanensis]|nr:hypothetical protein [Pseudomonas lalkuanensis]